MLLLENYFLANSGVEWSVGVNGGNQCFLVIFFLGMYVGITDLSGQYKAKAQSYQLGIWQGL